MVKDLKWQNICNMYNICLINVNVWVRACMCVGMCTCICMHMHTHIICMSLRIGLAGMYAIIVFMFGRGMKKPAPAHSSDFFDVCIMLSWPIVPTNDWGEQAFLAAKPCKMCNNLN